jgi:hypothetical protein
MTRNRNLLFAGPAIANPLILAAGGHDSKARVDNPLQDQTTVSAHLIGDPAEDDRKAVSSSPGRP